MKGREAVDAHPRRAYTPPIITSPEPERRVRHMTVLNHAALRGA
jgi:hypothetical protein